MKTPIIKLNRSYLEELVKLNAAAFKTFRSQTRKTLS